MEKDLHPPPMDLFRYEEILIKEGLENTPCGNSEWKEIARTKVSFYAAADWHPRSICWSVEFNPTVKTSFVASELLWLHLPSVEAKPTFVRGLQVLEILAGPARGVKMAE